MLAVMVRTTPVPASGTASPIRKWFMLLGPAMAAAAAVALWFAVDPGQRSAPSVLRELSKERAGSGPATAPAPEPAASPAIADKDRPPNKALDPFGSTQASTPREGQTSARQRDERDGADKLRAQVNEVKSESAKSVPAPIEPEKNPSTALIVAPPAQTAPPAPAPPMLERSQEARGSVAGAAAQNANQAQPNQGPANQAQANQAQNSQAPQANQVQSPPPPRQQALEDPVVIVTDSAGSRVAARKDAAAPADSASFRKVAAVLEIRTPDPAVRWRVADGRLVQRTLDAGATWVDQYTC